VLAADIGCRPATVLRALHRDGIDRRPGRPPRQFPHLHDPAWLRRRYLDDGLPARQLSADIGGSTGSVLRALRRHNIPTRGAQRHPQLADPAWLTRRYITDSATIADLAADIGCSPSAVRKALARASLSLRPHRTPPRSAAPPTTMPDAVAD
jgi:hypothetical protein